MSGLLGLAIGIGAICVLNVIENWFHQRRRKERQDASTAAFHEFLDTFQTDPNALARFRAKMKDHHD